MEENFNLTMVIILDEPIELSDLFSRSMKNENEKLRLDAPEVIMPGTPTNNLMITQGPIGFSFPKVIVGHNLVVFNVKHSDRKRGAFQVELRNTKGFDVSVELYKAMWQYVKSLNYENVYALEIVITFTAKYSKYPKFEMVENLETMRNPNFAGLRIIDGYTGLKDMREEFISEIRVESLPYIPAKSQVSAVYRFKEYEEDKLQKIFKDIEGMLNLIR
ncbi:MAG: hypothetical protein M1375_03955 [Candidatus Thermoplasmatota archaeon]|jgi:hypothetical protein|nr:hypothetical protein [Candidatus Thermoplasmatota archaeon]MCL5791108.1 hypothetical protein [Candidatus Thermoplasmatota archaeon]